MGAITARLGLFSTLVGNLIPLVGVLLFGWDLPSIVVMYWIETGAVGLVNVLRIHKSMALGQATVDAGGSIERPIVRGAGPGGWLLPLIWLLAYGLFWAILGVFVIQIANGGFYAGASQTGWNGASAAVVTWGTVSLIGGQVLAYLHDYVVGRRFLTVTSIELLRDPFVRILVMVGTITAGGVGIAAIGSPVGLLAAMVVVKTVIELRLAHPTPTTISAG